MDIFTSSFIFYWGTRSKWMKFYSSLQKIQKKSSFILLQFMEDKRMAFKSFYTIK